MNVCIFGGAFDPIHKGHIAIALSASNKFKFDKLLFMISKEPPHKSIHEISFSQRFNMVKLAISEFGDKFDVTDIEERQNTISYTYNSLNILKKLYSNDKLFFLVGSDIFASIEKWYNYEKLFDLAYFIIGYRPGISFDSMIKQVPNKIKDKILKKDGIELFDIESINISSSEIRNNIHKYIDYLPLNVANYILENNLYSKGI